MEVSHVTSGFLKTGSIDEVFQQVGEQKGWKHLLCILESTGDISGAHFIRTIT